MVAHFYIHEGATLPSFVFSFYGGVPSKLTAYATLAATKARNPARGRFRALVAARVAYAVNFDGTPP